MLIRISNTLLRRSYLSIFHKKIYFSFVSVAFSKQLTRKIIQANNEKNLIELLNKHSGNFNPYSLTALLKKVNKMPKPQQILVQKVFQEVKKQWSALYINEFNFNTRAIANIIGYTGNMKYHKIDELFKKINYVKFFKRIKSKQLVMTLTGLLKLQITQQCLEQGQLQNIILRKVDHFYHAGLIISLWRNLIKYNKCTLKLSNYLSSLISLTSTHYNLKDYGYLVYSFTQTHKQLKNREKIQGIISRYSQLLVSGSRINIFEMCILLDHLKILKNISPHIKLSDDFNFGLQMQYMRNIQSKTDLRSLANGYHSLTNYIKQSNFQIYSLTLQKFIEMIKDNLQTDDYQSISSLFLQFIDHSINKKVVFRKQTSSYIKEQKQLKKLQQSQLLQQITNYLLANIHGQQQNSCSQKNIDKISNKDFQKIIYTFYLYIAKINTSYKLNNYLNQKIKQNILKRKFNGIQINSVLQIIPVIQVKSQKICHLFKQQIQKIDEQIKNKYKLQNRLDQKCILGCKSDCLNCFI